MNSGTLRSTDLALLLAVWPARHQFSPPFGGSDEPVDPRRFWSLDERHPLAADGVDHRVCPHDHDRLSFPGATIRCVGRAGHGRFAVIDAPALWAGPPDRYRHARPLALVGDRPRVLERAARAPCAALEGRRWHPARPGLRREDGSGHGALAASTLADSGIPAADLHSPGRTT